MTSQPDIQAQVEHADRARRAAMLAGDVAALERLIAPDGIYIHNNGLRETGAQYLAQMGQQTYAYSRVDLVDCTWRLHEDIAVVAGTQYLEAGLRDGPKHSLKMLAVIVWERRGGIWMMVHFQSTLLTGA